MRIKTTVRCEDSSLCLLPMNDETQSEMEASLLALPGVVGCRFKGMAGSEVGIFNIVHRLGKAVVCDVPQETAESLMTLGYAVDASEN